MADEGRGTRAAPRSLPVDLEGRDCCPGGDDGGDGMMRDFLLDNLPGCDMLGMSLSVGVPETSSRDTGPHLEEFVSANDSPKQWELYR